MAILQSCCILMVVTLICQGHGNPVLKNNGQSNDEILVNDPFLLRPRGLGTRRNCLHTYLWCLSLTTNIKPFIFEYSGIAYSPMQSKPPILLELLYAAKTMWDWRRRLWRWRWLSRKSSLWTQQLPKDFSFQQYMAFRLWLLYSDTNSWLMTFWIDEYEENTVALLLHHKMISFQLSNLHRPFNNISISIIPMKFRF